MAAHGPVGCDNSVFHIAMEWGEGCTGSTDDISSAEGGRFGRDELVSRIEGGLDREHCRLFDALKDSSRRLHV